MKSKIAAPIIFACLFFGTCWGAPVRKLHPRGQFQPSPDNPVCQVRVLVLNYDPKVPSEGHQPLHKVFRWNDPRQLAHKYQREMERVSGGAVHFSIVEFRTLNEIYAQMDGYRYTVEEYVKNRRAGKGWHDGRGADYPRLLREQGVDKLINEDKIDEVWIFSDHFFGLWEASMAGPGAFNINGGVYPDFPTTRPFAFYGFNYERGVAEMVHDTCHRTEATLNKVFGGWKLEDPKNDWELFSANFKQSNGLAGVGTCHYPANGKADYNYDNSQIVDSWAFDFLNYPNLVCRDRKSGLSKVNADSWKNSGDAQLDYLSFYFTLLPRAEGKTQGKLNNWWRYIYDFRRTVGR